MSSLIRDWREMRRAWKRFLAALLSITADDLVEAERREVTGLAEERVCPLMRMAWAIAQDDRTPQECVKDGCAWWVASAVPRGGGEYEYRRECALTKIAMSLHRMALR